MTHATDATKPATNNPPALRGPGLTVGLTLAFIASTSALRAEFSLFVRGDTNADGVVDIADPIRALEYLFLGGSVDCQDAGDANDDGAVDIADPIFTLGYLFLGGEALPAPGATLCGLDPSADTLIPCKVRSCPGSEIFVELQPANLELPGERSSEQAARFQSGRLEEALDGVLNSPGDSLQLELEAGFSIAIVAIVNVNGKITYKAAITVAEDGAHEVSIDYSRAGGLGVELAEGIEANARLGVATTLVFRFEDIAQTVRALQDMALSLIVEPARAEIEALFGLAASAAADLDAALADLDAALTNESMLADRLDSLNSSWRAVDREISETQDKLRDVVDELAQIACDLFPNRCDELRADRNRLNDKLDDLQAQRRALVNQITDTEAQLAAARAAVAGARDGVQAAEAALLEAEQTVAEARHLIDALIGAQDRIGLSFSGYQFRVPSTMDAQAAFSPFPGVKVGGFNFGASVEAEIAVGGRLDFSTASRPERFTLFRTSKRTLTLQAGAIESKSFVEVTVDTAFDKQDGWFSELDSSIKLALDAQVEEVLGFGAVVRLGVGSNIVLEFPLGQVAEHLGEIVNGLLEGDGSTLGRTLLGVSATITRADRRMVGAGIDIGVSYVGYGGSFKGIGSWTDVGEITSQTIDAGSVVGAVVGAGEDLLAALGERLDGESNGN